MNTTSTTTPMVYCIRGNTDICLSHGIDIGQWPDLPECATEAAEQLRWAAWHLVHGADASVVCECLEYHFPYLKRFDPATGLDIA